MTSPLTAGSVVAAGIPVDLREEYRQLGYVSDLTISAAVTRAAQQMARTARHP